MRTLYIMYTVKLTYPTERTQTYKESMTYCASIDLYALHGIDCAQSSATTLVFDSDRDRVFALLALSKYNYFSAVCVD